MNEAGHTQCNQKNEIRENGCLCNILETPPSLTRQTGMQTLALGFSIGFNSPLPWTTANPRPTEVALRQG